MKKYFEIYFSSFKQSLLHKPTALIMLVCMIIVATIVCGIGSRILVSDIAYSMSMPKGLGLSINEVDDYKKVGDYIYSLQEEVSFADDSEDISVGFITMYSYNTVITYGNDQDNSVTTSVTTEIDLEIFDDLHTKESIENGENIMIVNREFLKSSGARVGQTINFMGSDFVIIAENNVMTRESSDSANPQVCVPYSAQLVNVAEVVDKDEDGEYLPKEDITGCFIRSENFNNFERNLSESENEQLISLGAEVYVQSLGAGFWMGLVMLITILVGSCLAIMSTMNYWQKINDRKYAVYKTLGASPAVVAGVMVSETFVVASIAVGIGLLLEHLANIVLNIGYLSSWAWLHYLILFSATLLSVMMMMTVKVVKRARAVPASKMTVI